MNSELKQRVRTVNGLVCHKAVAKQDIKHIVKVVQNLDSLHGVWDEGEEDDNFTGRRSYGDDANSEAADTNPEERKEVGKEFLSTSSQSSLISYLLSSLSPLSSLSIKRSFTDDMFFWEIDEQVARSWVVKDATTFPTLNRRGRCFKIRRRLEWVKLLFVLPCSTTFT